MVWDKDLELGIVGGIKGEVFREDMGSIRFGGGEGNGGMMGDGA